MVRCCLFNIKDTKSVSRAVSTVDSTADYSAYSASVLMKFQRLSLIKTINIIAVNNFDVGNFVPACIEHISVNSHI